MSKSKVGVTGTREGMTPRQRDAFEDLIRQLDPVEFHHGDCVGVDAQASEFVYEYHTNDNGPDDECTIHCHPPIDKTHQAFTSFNDVTHPPLTHFARNREIVKACDVLIGVSLMPERQTSGGTWYTISHAINKGKTVYVIWPDGKVELLQGG